ncbi:MAG: trigger factor [Bauldia sp.]|nr:trigger factor [Bauldia sp.]
MQVTETLSEGLKREFKVVVPASEMDSRLVRRLEEMKGTARIKGFRPGKVPVQHLRRIVGRQTMSEIVNDLLQEQANRILQERGERAALQPSFDLPEDEAEAEKVLDAKADFEYTMKYEVLPSFQLGDFKSIAIERPVVSIPDADIERQVELLARNAATYTVKDGKAETGDRVTIDYVGKLDGEPFDGGADQGAHLILGSGQFIPGFEEQLVGVKAGDKRSLDIRFPDDYGATNLAGKDAVFDVTVSEVAAPDSVAIDDALAAKLGVQNVDELRAAVRRQLESQYAPLARQLVKRRLLDALDSMHSFDLPPTMVEQEFDAIWREVENEMKQAGRTFESEGTTEEESRGFYRQIADRRVRLGLVLSEIGQRNQISVSEQELQKALTAEIRRYPGREQEIYDFYNANPQALTRLRAPVFEEKVVDFLLELVNVTDKPVTGTELIKLNEEAEEAIGQAPDPTRAG